MIKEREKLRTSVSPIALSEDSMIGLSVWQLRLKRSLA